MTASYWLTNVLLESGYRYKDGVVAGTLTDVFHIYIEDGKISKIISSDETIIDELPQRDANRMLMLPGFRDMHIHLDKTYYGGPWKACTPFVSIFDRIKEEEELIPQLLPVREERAKKNSRASCAKRGNPNTRPVQCGSH